MVAVSVNHYYSHFLKIFRKSVAFICVSALLLPQALIGQLQLNAGQEVFILIPKLLKLLLDQSAQWL